MRPPRLAPAGLLCLVACTLGPEFKNFGPAHAPEGVHVQASLAAPRASGPWTEVRGELLEVRIEGLLVLGTLAEARLEGRPSVLMRQSDQRKRVLLVPFGRLRTARFEGTGRCCELDNGALPKDRARERLRLYSRFPQGLSPELLRRLLELQGQTEVQKVGP
jgi:hypothetical protein